MQSTNTDASAAVNPTDEASPPPPVGADGVKPTCCRRRAIFILIPFLLLIALVAVQGSTRSAASAASMFSASPVPSLVAGEQATFRVVSMNIRSGVGTDNKLNLDRVGQNFDGANIVGLNEVRAYRFGKLHDQAQDLGERLKMSFLFAPAERRWWADDFGNAVLSSGPLQSWQRIPLPCTQTRGFRNVTMLTAKIGDRPVKVLVTHLDHVVDRKQQLAAVSDLFCSLQPPVILMGDLNTDYDDPVIQPLLNRPDVINTMSPGVCKNLPKDVEYILVRGLKVKEAGWQDNGASDHCSIWADLQLP